MCRLLLCVMGFAALTAFGAPISFNECPAVGNDTSGCELLITVTSVDSSGASTAFFVTTSSPDQGPFDGEDDTLVGIINESSGTLKSIALAGSGDDGGIFAFDSDGACSGDYTPGPTPAQCGGPLNTSNPFDYGSAGVSFTGITADDTTGTVLVGGAAGLTNGESTWFSLESSLKSGDLQVGLIPEPGPIGLTGAGLAMLLGLARRRIRGGS